LWCFRFVTSDSIGYLQKEVFRKEFIYREQFECDQRSRGTMPIKLADAVAGANAASSSADRLFAQEDPALVAGGKTGNARAFELSVQQHERKILLLAQRVTRNREAAKDVVQQSFQKAFIHFKKFEGESLFSTWLARIAINEALMLLCWKRRSCEVPLSELPAVGEIALPLAVPDLGLHPEDSCLWREQQRSLSAAVNELPPGTRKAIQLRELDERSTDETAHVMGLSVGAVKARVFHGRRKLRKTLQRYEPAVA
jgi:RNA polymerase sigma-70 factor, ECF subfamily